MPATQWREICGEEEITGDTTFLSRQEGWDAGSRERVGHGRKQCQFTRSNGEKTEARDRGSSPQCLRGQESEEVPFCLVAFLKEIRIKVISREGLRKRTF